MRSRRYRVGKVAEAEPGTVRLLTFFRRTTGYAVSAITFGQGIMRLAVSPDQFDSRVREVMAEKRAWFEGVALFTNFI